MNQLQWLQSVITQYSEPAMIAQAYADFYQRVYERKMDLAAYLQSDTSITTYDNAEEGSQIIPYTSDTNSVVGIQASDLKIALQQYFTDLESNPNASAVKSVVDKLTNGNVEINVEDFINEFGASCDTTFITMSAFQAIVNNINDAGENFATVVNTYIGNKDVQLASTISSIYTTLVNGVSTLADKVSSIIEFVGINSAFNTAPADALTADTTLGDCTGVNPLSAWIDGIDIDFSTVTGVVTYVAKATVSIVKTIGSFIGGLMSKAVKWIGGKIHNTFVDPVDYKCDDEFLQWFKVPARFRFSNEGESTINSLKTDFDNRRYLKILRYYLKRDDTPVYWSVLGPNAYKVYLLGDNICCERYVKPVSLVGLDQALSPLNGKTAANLTIDDMSSVIYSLSASDLLIDNKAEEEEVYVGIAASLYYSEMMGTLFNALAFQLHFSDVVDTLNNTEATPSTLVSTIGSSVLSTWYQKLFTLRDAVKAWIAGSSFDLSIYGKLFTHDHGQTVTNAEFRDLLFSAFRETGEDMTFDMYVKGYYDPSEVSADDYNLTMGQNFPILPGLTLKYALSDVYPNADGAWFPYKHSNDVNLVMNVDLVTDDQHTQAVASFFQTSVIASAVIAVTVITGVKLLKMRTAARKLSVITDTLGRNYANAVVSGSPDADLLFKQYNASRRKSWLLSKLTGTATATATNVSGGFIDPFSSTDITPVIKLIDSRQS